MKWRYFLRFSQFPHNDIQLGCPFSKFTSRYKTLELFLQSSIFNLLIVTILRMVLFPIYSSISCRVNSFVVFWSKMSAFSDEQNVVVTSKANRLIILAGSWVREHQSNGYNKKVSFSGNQLSFYLYVDEMI